jgi:septal ring factor EnvC (AmiA/AmiB activator)
MMKHSTTIMLAAALLASHAAAAQTDRSYAGQHTRAIKALSPDEMRGYLDGAGMGFAKAAELNRYPGPMHALELADALALTAEQRSALQSLMAQHKDEARALGAEVVRLEGELDRLFAERRATADQIDRLTAAIGAAQGRVRAAHLKTHLAATALLMPAQIASYAKLRGYDAPGDSAPMHHGRAH